VLEIEKANIGVRDSFFDLGGHSLKAIRIMTRIYEQFDIEIDLTDLFRQPYIESLAEEVENILWLKQLNS
jgi:acyl carrier protein